MGGLTRPRAKAYPAISRANFPLSSPPFHKPCKKMQTLIGIGIQRRSLMVRYDVGVVMRCMCTRQWLIAE